MRFVGAAAVFVFHAIWESRFIGGHAGDVLSVVVGRAGMFGVGFFFLYPAVLGRPKPTAPEGDFHLIAMTEQPDHYVEMWVGEKTGSRLYRFQTSTDVRQKLRGMTDGKGVGIYSLTGHFVKPGGPMGNEALQLDVTPPDATTLPPKNEP